MLIFLLACSPGSTGDDTLIDGILRPDPELAAWVEGVNHPHFPLPVGAVWEYEATTDVGFEQDHVEVLAETRDVNGVTATVVYDLVNIDGVKAEETWDWFAQDSDGNVWYLGEDSCEWDAGACADTHGSWEWGVDGALPGWALPADPTVDGQPYFQEYFEGEAEDVGEVIAVGESITVAAGSYTDCVRTRDTSHLDATLNEEKVYCPDLGNVFTQEPGGDAALVSYVAR